MARVYGSGWALVAVAMVGCGGTASAPVVAGSGGQVGSGGQGSGSGGQGSGSGGGLAATPDGGGGDSSGPSGSGGADAQDNGPPTTWAVACSASTQMWCERMAACGPFVFRHDFGDQAYCQARQMEACLQVNDLPSTTFTPASMAACTTALKALSCNDWYAAITWEVHVPAACQPGKGTAPATTSCALDKQCQSQFCQVADGATCGTCKDQIAVGKPCTSTDRCAGDGHCGADGRCAAQLGAGQACQENTDCSGDLYCVAGQCMNLRKSGEVCPTDDYCDAFLTCLNGKCALAGRVGDPCSASADGDSCSWSQGAFCAPDNKCIATQLMKSGQPCDPSNGVLCDRDAKCFSPDGGPGDCVATLALGASCTPDGVPCRISADCVNGTCVVNDLKVCK